MTFAEEREKAREESLSAIGKGYIEMRHNRAVGFMVYLQEKNVNIDGDLSGVNLVSFGMDSGQMIHMMMTLVEQMLEDES